LRFKCLLSLIIFALLLIFADSTLSINVEVSSDIYPLLSKLESEGVIQSSMLTSKPLSRQEIIKLILEAEENAEGRSSVIRKIVKTLKARFESAMDGAEYIKPAEDVYGQYVHTDSESSDKVVYNNDGYNYKKGSNLKLGILSTAELSHLSFHFNPEFRYNENDTEILLSKAYAILDFAGLALEIGKDSQWWGPGYHGSLLLSNNAEPLTVIKLTNKQPTILPSVLRHFGLFKFTFFVTTLDEDRVISKPFLWGMRFNFKPNPYFEMGINRTALLGGEGRSNDIETWLKSFAGQGENEPGSGSGDQRGGLDMKFTLPYSVQPLQVYAEAAGEDEAGSLPTKWAYLAGIYLPRILNYGALEFRAEFATTHISGFPNVWYNHSVYRSGYTYKGRVMGHHMGTDSRDLFFELQYLIPEIGNGRLIASYDREKSNLSEEINETVDQYKILFKLPVKKELNLEAAYSFNNIDNLDNVDGANRNINILTSSVTYKF
jgi:hypothetical protein